MLFVNNANGIKPPLSNLKISASKLTVLPNGEFFHAHFPPHEEETGFFIKGLSEKSKFSDFSTRCGDCFVKNARNPQRISALFALHSLTPYEKSVHFFVFRNALQITERSFIAKLDRTHLTINA